MLETVRKFEYNRLSPEEMSKRHILGRLVGIMADFKNPTRNSRLYSEELWDKTFDNPIMKEKLDNRCLLGELGHPEDRTEIDIEKVAICLAELPKKLPDGTVHGVFDILDTPNGRLLKTLCEYGCNIGVSSRGTGDVVEDFNGQESVLPDTYECECWDAVLLPAVKSARPQYVTESLAKKTLKTALIEELKKSTETEKKVMEQTLNELDIDYSEDTKLEESRTYTPEDNVTPITDRKVLNLFPGRDMWSVYKPHEQELNKHFKLGDIFKFTDSTYYKDKLPGTTIKVLDVAAVTGYDNPFVIFDWTTDKGTKLNRMDLDQFTSMLNNSTYELIEEVITHESVNYIDNDSSNSDTETANNVGELVKDLQESLKRELDLNAQITKLQEKLSVCYTKESDLEDELAKYKSSVISLSDSAKENKSLKQKVASLTEELDKAKKLVETQTSRNDSLKESYRGQMSETRSLKEALTRKDSEISDLRAEVKQLKESLSNQLNTSNEREHNLQEDIANLKKNSAIKQTEYAKKLNTSNKLVEKYKQIAKTSLNKYIESRAINLGISAEDIKTKLNENYTFSDIDSACESLRKFKLNLNKLPFAVGCSDRQVRYEIKESLNNQVTDTNDDDRIDDMLIHLAGLK